MANYDRPAITYPTISVNLNPQSAAGDINLLSVTAPSSWLESIAAMENAFAEINGGAGGPASYPIGG